MRKRIKKRTKIITRTKRKIRKRKKKIKKKTRKRKKKLRKKQKKKQRKRKKRKKSKKRKRKNRKIPIINPTITTIIHKQANQKRLVVFMSTRRFIISFVHVHYLK